PRRETRGLRWVASRVTAPAGSLVHYLLGQVGIVDHLDQAEALWRRNGVVATYVTPGGEVLGPTRRLPGGGEARSDIEPSLLARKRRGRGLDEEIQRLTETLEASPAAAAAPAAEGATPRARIGGLEQSVQARQAERLTSEKDLEQSVREHERVYRHRETVVSEGQQVRDELTQTSTTLQTLEQHVAAAAEAETRQEQTMAARRPPRPAAPSLPTHP